jgi:hypothetical protein
MGENHVRVLGPELLDRGGRGKKGEGACVVTLLLEECEDDTHTLEMGTWESTGTLETSEFDCRGQNTSH